MARSCFGSSLGSTTAPVRDPPDSHPGHVSVSPIPVHG
jgi:hypothetical protein